MRIPIYYLYLHFQCLNRKNLRSSDHVHVIGTKFILPRNLIYLGSCIRLQPTLRPLKFRRMNIFLLHPAHNRNIPERNM